MGDAKVKKGKKGKKIKDEVLETKKETISKVSFSKRSTLKVLKDSATEMKSQTQVPGNYVSVPEFDSAVDLDSLSSSEEALLTPERKRSSKPGKVKGKQKEKAEKPPKKKAAEKPEKEESGKKKQKKKKTEFKEDVVKTIIISGREFGIDILAIREEQLGTLTVDLEFAPPEVEDTKKKKKKAKPKKLSKEEKRRFEQQQQEEEARLIAEEKRRLEEEKILAIEKYNRDIFEQEIREEQLARSIDKMDKFYERYTDIIREEKVEEEWKRYIACGILPDPTKCAEMTTYLHLWDEVILKTSMEDASKRTRDVLHLLNEIDDILDRALPEDEPNRDKLKWIHQMLRENQDESLTVATYEILRWVEKNLIRNDVRTSDFHFKDENVTFNLWLRVQLPIPLPNPRRPPKSRISVSFPNIPMDILLPPTMDCEKMALRGMHLKYDHLSDQCANYYLPSVEQDFERDILAHVKYEWRIKQKYRYYYRDVPATDNTQIQAQISHAKSTVSEKSDKLSVGPSYSNLVQLIIKALETVDADVEFLDYEDEEIPVVPYQKLEPSPSNLFLVKDYTTYKTIYDTFLQDLPFDTICLREFVILGGIFYFNIVHQPPQPQEFVNLELVLSRFSLPKKLEYSRGINATPDSSLLEEQSMTSSLSTRSSHLVAGVQQTRSNIGAATKSAQRMEELRKSKASVEEFLKSASILQSEARKSRMSSIALAEKEKKVEEPDDLIKITIKWPQNVIFSELPRICHWEPSEKCWSTRYVYTVSHDEDKSTITFKSEVCGAFAFAQHRYIHLPYKNWKVKTRADGSVIIIIRAAMMNFQFNIKNGLICLDTYEVYPNPVLKPLEKVYMKLSRLIRTLKELGIDIFPEPDAVCYVKNNSEKLWPLEKHLYCDMARMYTCFNFASSNYNAQSGRRNVLLQMKQTFMARTKYYSLVHATPLRVTYLQCSEASEIFAYDEMENMRFSSDLYNLMKTTCGIIIRNEVQLAPPENVVTLAEFLIATRLLSFSGKEEPPEEEPEPAPPALNPDDIFSFL